MTTLGDRIKTLRQENNLTQEQLGKMFGLTKYSISLYESNKSSPNDEFKTKLASFFNVSVDWLLGRTDERLTAHLLKEESLQYNIISTSNSFLDDLLQKVPDLTEKEKASLADHLEFAMKLIEKERQERAQEKK